MQMLNDFSGINESVVFIKHRKAVLIKRIMEIYLLALFLNSQPFRFNNNGRAINPPQTIAHC